MSPRVIFALCATLCTSVAASVSAQSDVPGAKDHPMISRYPGSFAFDYLEKNFEGIDVPTGPVVTTPQGKYT